MVKTKLKLIDCHVWKWNSEYKLKIKLFYEQKKLKYMQSLLHLEHHERLRASIFLSAVMHWVQYGRPRCKMPSNTFALQQRHIFIFLAAGASGLILGPWIRAARRTSWGSIAGWYRFIIGCSCSTISPLFLRSASISGWHRLCLSALPGRW